MAVTVTNFNDLSDRDRKADDIINKKAGFLAVAGIFNPFPLIGDPPIIIGNWVVMLLQIADTYDVDVSESTLRRSLGQVIRSVGWYLFGTKTFLMVGYWTGFGTAASMVANGALNAAITVAVGKSYKNSFRKGYQPSQSDLESSIKDAIKNPNKYKHN